MAIIEEFNADTAEKITRLFSLPGNAPGGGYEARMVYDDERVAIHATTTQAFARLTVIPSKQFVAFAWTDVENGLCQIRAIDENGCFSYKEQDWKPGKGNVGDIRVITPKDPGKMVFSLLHVASSAFDIAKP